MHHSNIAYIDSIIDPEAVEVVHFVEPGLMRRLGSGAGFPAARAGEQVERQLAWMASCDLDAILITCTNYIAMLPDTFEPGLPLIKIDEPFFAELLRQPAPHLLLFTNPATVEGTMRRFAEFAQAQGPEVDLDVDVIEGTFELVIAGRTDEYTALLASRLREVIDQGRFASISVGQLSMANAAHAVTEATGFPITNLLDALRVQLSSTL
jgi:hypothetical protein